MSRGSNNQPSPFFFIILIIIIVSLVISFSPGMLLVGLINYIGLFYFDKGQMWAFSILLSIILFASIYFKLERDLNRSLKLYGIISLSVVSILALFYFGFKVAIPGILAGYFF